MTIIKTFDTEIEEKIFNWRSKRFIMVSFFLVVLAVAEIWVNNSVSSLSGQFENINNLQKNLTLENQLLENEIAKQESLQNIASQSSILGFKSPKTIQYLR